MGSFNGARSRYQRLVSYVLEGSVGNEDNEAKTRSNARSMTLKGMKPTEPLGLQRSPAKVISKGGSLLLWDNELQNRDQ